MDRAGPAGIGRRTGPSSGFGRGAIGRALAAASFALVWTCHPASAAPADATTLAVVAPPCVGRPYDRARLLEMLRVELSAMGVSSVVALDGGAAPPAGPGILATVSFAPASCDAEAQEVTLQVVDHATSKTVGRRMAIGDVEVPERPRVLAIAVAELLTASLAEMDVVGAGPPAVEVGPAVRAALAARLLPAIDAARAESEARTREALDAADRRARASAAAASARAEAPLLEAGALARAFPAQGTGLFGGAAGLRLRSGAWALHVGADAGFGSVQIPAGSVRVGAVTGTVGGGLVTPGPVELEVSPRLHAGYAYGSGSPDRAGARGQSYGSAVVVLVVAATLRIHTEADWVGLVGAEVGYTLADVSFLADASRVAGLGGPMVGLTAGVGFGL